MATTSTERHARNRSSQQRSPGPAGEKYAGTRSRSWGPPAAGAARAAERTSGGGWLVPPAGEGARGDGGGQGGEPGEQVPAPEGGAAGATAIQDTAEAEQVAAGGGTLAAGLLGGHVGGGADQEATARQVRGGADGLGEPEVED